MERCINWAKKKRNHLLRAMGGGITEGYITVFSSLAFSHSILLQFFVSLLTSLVEL